MESFFKTLKVERVDQVRYDSRGQAKLDIVDWIEGFYNRQRLHSSVRYRTPVQDPEAPATPDNSGGCECQGLVDRVVVA